MKHTHTHTHTHTHWLCRQRKWCFTSVIQQSVREKLEIRQTTVTYRPCVRLCGINLAALQSKLWENLINFRTEDDLLTLCHLGIYPPFLCSMGHIHTMCFCQIMTKSHSPRFILSLFHSKTKRYYMASILLSLTISQSLEWSRPAVVERCTKKSKIKECRQKKPSNTKMPVHTGCEFLLHKLGLYHVQHATHAGICVGETTTQIFFRNIQ